jgi:lipid-binding SYLF domain-containing protein
VGRHASAGTDWKLETEILSYSHAKGAFAGVALDGSVVEPDKETIRAVYGKDLTTRVILSGRVRPPEEADVFLEAVRRMELKAKS